jgi:coenzyme F420-reducing hydrogenase delta subunit/Pyruvate/2-oxoacid:ferredoxin oxidoreductase delta subunit
MALLHAARYTFARRFVGPRWLAWVTGGLAVFILWFVGFTGYWLVWDERAQQIALGTAKMLDLLPVFVDPLSRSFLVDSSIKSLFFFLVFFAHMLIPLAMMFVLWLHITRLSRPRFLAGRKLSLWILVTLGVMSALWPARSADPAGMLSPPVGFTMDYWYILPIALTDRLSGGMLWLLFVVPSMMLLTVPWWLARGHASPAVVDAAKCNACEKCFVDCPYGAITMVPRISPDEKHPVQASVNPRKCVGCGICSGSCDTAGIGIAQPSQLDARKHLDAWLARAIGDGETPVVAFLCADSGAAAVHIDPATGRAAELPGYICWALPCAGWLHSLTIERAFRHGAKGVLIAACGPGACQFREGALWTEQRIEGGRAPALRDEKVDRSRVRVLRLHRFERRELLAQAAAFRSGGSKRDTARARRVPAVATAAALAIGLGGGTVLGSDLPYATGIGKEPVLTVSFNHPGRSEDRCHEVTEAEKAALPPHMRQDRVCDRGRSPVRLRVAIDGMVVHEESYGPHGIFGDENSIAVVHVPVTEGIHRVEVAVGDSADPSEWTFTDARRIEFLRGRRHVTLFDRTQGFSWY